MIEAIIKSKLNNGREVVNVIAVTEFYAIHKHPDYQSKVSNERNEDAHITEKLNSIHFPSKVCNFSVTHIRKNFDGWQEI